MKDIRRPELTAEELQKIAERKNKPSAIAHRLGVQLSTVESPHTRYEGFLENIALAIQRHKVDKESFTIDTITCPQYAFLSALGPYEDFSSVSGVEMGIEMGKFQRYLLTLSFAARFFGELDIPISLKARVYFGDVGVLGVERIKEQFRVEDDEQVRKILTRVNGGGYKEYFIAHREKFGLEGVDMQFLNLTDVDPHFKQIPLDLHEMARTGFVVQGKGMFNMNAYELTKRGVDPKIIRTASHTAEHLSFGRKNGNFMFDDTTENTFLEIGGFLLAYGLAGRALAFQDQPTDLLVSADPPGSYRNDFYYAFLGRKGEKLAVFTPDTIQALSQKGLIK